MANTEPPLPPKLSVEIHLVSSVETPEFALMETTLRRSSIVGLDAEWKPIRRQRSSSSEPAASPSTSSEFPTVTVLQIACRCRSEHSDLAGKGLARVFVVDLMSVPAIAVWEMLRDMFVAQDVIKLGFRFKQDLVYLSSTFDSQGCHPGFDTVAPFLDITSLYHYLTTNAPAKKFPKETKSLATICKELLNISLSKELQCSDWSCRPLTPEQISYAAADAYYLLEIFDMFHCNVKSEGTSVSNMSKMNPGLKEIFETSTTSDNILGIKFCHASDMINSSSVEIISKNNYTTIFSATFRNYLPLDESLSRIAKIYGEWIFLKESDKTPKISKKEGKRQSLASSKIQNLNEVDDWEGPPPWDPSLGGDGLPKFLCDIMIEGLAKHLRCVGFDAAVPSLRKPEPRQLINQAHKEKRVLLTRDAKLLKYQYIIHNQVYKVKSLLKNEQLLEVIDTFQLKINEDQLMSRCTKCNGSFIQKPLSIEEAIEASRGFQIIPNCLFNKDLEFWQCTDCNQLYWEGTQYHNAVQKFINVCKLNG